MTPLAFIIALVLMFCFHVVWWQAILWGMLGYVIITVAFAMIFRR